MDELYVSKGKKTLHFDLPQKGADDEIANLILGRSGTLRAPVLRIGKTLIVGFSEEALQKVVT